MSRIPAGRALGATLLGAALATGCGSGDPSKTYTAVEPHGGGVDRGQAGVPAVAKGASTGPKGYAGPTR